MGWVKVVFPFKTNHEAGMISLMHQKKYLQHIVLERRLGFFFIPVP